MNTNTNTNTNNRLFIQNLEPQDSGSGCPYGPSLAWPGMGLTNCCGPGRVAFYSDPHMMEQVGQRAIRGCSNKRLSVVDASPQVKLPPQNVYYIFMERNY